MTSCQKSDGRMLFMKLSAMLVMHPRSLRAFSTVLVWILLYFLIPTVIKKKETLFLDYSLVQKLRRRFVFKSQISDAAFCIATQQLRLLRRRSLTLCPLKLPSSTRAFEVPKYTFLLSFVFPRDRSWLPAQTLCRQSFNILVISSVSFHSSITKWTPSPKHLE